MSARRHYRKYKANTGGVLVPSCSTTFAHGVPHGEGTLVWENILKWRQSDRFVLLYLMPRLFHVLPKSVASQGFDVAALVERLNRHVGPEA
jgi:hypothetical protein